MKNPVTITISKPSGRDAGSFICVRIRDEKSRIQFIEAEFTLHDFMDALTGHAEMEGTAEYRGLEFLGKQCVLEDRSKECPLKSYDKEELQKWLVKNCQEEGWILEPYLGSQTSVSRLGGKTVLNYSVRKYV